MTARSAHSPCERPIGGEIRFLEASVDSPKAEPRKVREVFDAHAAWVLRVLGHLGVLDADVPDASQEVFLVVHRKLAGFEGRSSLRTWLYGICVRVAAARRRAGRRRAEPALLSPPETPPSPQDALERRRDTERLRAILASLDGEKREVFVLFEIEGLTMKEVTEAIGCPLQTGYTRLHAARAEVLAAWKRAAARESR